MARIICDVGSTHGNSWSAIDAFLDTAAELQVDVKFQLWGPGHEAGTTNLTMDRGLFANAVAEGRKRDVLVFSSVFDEDSYRFLADTGVNTIKFAHSMRFHELTRQAVGDQQWDEILISCNYLDVPSDTSLIPDRVYHLWCIPEYPVPFVPNFDGVFGDGRFQGFSDHTLGWQQSVRAEQANAEIIEKHVAISDYECPDGRFAINPAQLRQMVNAIEGVPCEYLS